MLIYTGAHRCPERQSMSPPACFTALHHRSGSECVFSRRFGTSAAQPIAPLQHCLHFSMTGLVLLAACAEHLNAIRFALKGNAWRASRRRRIGTVALGCPTVLGRSKHESHGPHPHDVFHPDMSQLEKPSVLHTFLSKAGLRNLLGS